MIYKIPQGNGAYYHAPKCGSRSVIGWIVLLSDPQLYIENPDLFSPYREKYTKGGERISQDYPELRDRIIQARKAGFTTEGKRMKKRFWKNSVAPKIAADYRFCVVRDPVDRFVSGFTNRILWHKSPTGVDITITDFINNFDSFYEEYKTIRTHFMPQIKWYGKDPSIFTHIFNIKQMSQVKTLLEEKSGQALPDIHLQQNGGIEKPTLTGEQIEWVKDKYKEDYEIYGKWFNKK